MIKAIYGDNINISFTYIKVYNNLQKNIASFVDNTTIFVLLLRQ